MEETGSKQNGWKVKWNTEKRGAMKCNKEWNEDIEETYIEI